MVGVSPTGGPSATPDPSSGNDASASMQQILNIRVSTLGQLKDVLTQALGKDAGTKLYNKFLEMIATTMISPLQQASQDAQQAAKQMKEESS
jgi:hypothetical protein